MQQGEKYFLDKKLSKLNSLATLYSCLSLKQSTSPELLRKLENCMEKDIDRFPSSKINLGSRDALITQLAFQNTINWTIYTKILTSYEK